MRELEAYLDDKEYIAFDSETTGVEKDSKIIGFSVCADVSVGYYVVLSYWDNEKQILVDLDTQQYAQDILSMLEHKRLIMQNAIFDCEMVKNNYSISLIESVFHDTLISGHILNENRQNGLKERAVALYGENAAEEQRIMKESVHKNGGVLSKEKYELYKADADLIAHYGAKDAILTLKLFYEDVPQLFEEGLDKFFYDEESMPLLKGPTYDLNTVGLKVDTKALQKLKKELQTECLELKAFIHTEIEKHVKDKYPGTGKTNHFNIGASKQLAWLLYFKLGNEFHTLTKGGRDLCKAVGIKVPYSPAAKREFIQYLVVNKDHVYEDGKYNYKTGKTSRPKKIGDPWNYIACGKESLGKLKDKYKWVDKLLEYAKALKLLNTYVEGIETRMRYNIIHPSFLQHGTTSGRYASRNPNFQNLPRKDKRIKACIVARPGMVFVGADYSQLEPRVFASVSQDEKLLKSFKDKDDFYSVIGAEVFNRQGYSLKKDAPGSFSVLFPDERDQSKGIALSSTYGTTAPKMAPALGIEIDEAQHIIDNYFKKFPSVQKMMLESHEQVKENGYVTNLFGRPRRIPLAKNIKQVYGNTKHSELPYDARNMLNLAVNHRIQSTAASIMNRAAIAVYYEARRLGWNKIRIVLQVHDELILEGPEEMADQMVQLLKNAMENTIKLPGVDLIAEPKVAKNLADLK